MSGQGVNEDGKASASKAESHEATEESMKQAWQFH